MKHVKLFENWLNEGNQSLLNLKQSEEEYIETMESSDGEPEEIASAKTGFVAIAKALNAKPEDIVCLLNHDEDEPVIIGHPDLADDESYRFSSFYAKIGKCPNKEIWMDEYWGYSPGGNHIYLYECPAEDGGTIKVAVWSGAGWDFPYPYILASDLNRRLK
jgi:hypothetical protein